MDYFDYISSHPLAFSVPVFIWAYFRTRRTKLRTKALIELAKLDKQSDSKLDETKLRLLKDEEESKPRFIQELMKRINIF